MTKSTLKWAELNPFDIPQKGIKSDLSPKAQAAYKVLKETYAKTKDAREAFEDIVRKEAAERNVIPDGHRVAFSYNFGRLSVAIAPKEAERKAKEGAGWAGLTV